MQMQDNASAPESPTSPASPRRQGGRVPVAGTQPPNPAKPTVAPSGAAPGSLAQHQRVFKHHDRPTVAPADAAGSCARLSSRQLLGNGSEVEIDHRGCVYRLRLTALGKLILTK